MKLQRDLLGLAVLFLLSSLPSSAQTTAGVAGTITDESGAAVAGVTVTITNVETSLQRETATDESGFYQLLLLQPGAYTLTAKKAGFRQAARERFRLEVNQRPVIDLTLQVGSVTETVEVLGSAPLLEASTSS